MAKSVITGSARGVSSDDFNKRMARLAPLPERAAQDPKHRSARNKPAYKPTPEAQTEPASDTPDEKPEEN
ncbi:MAG: hypothetical protein PGN34_13580 [Methylobacterium frigidaeris]